MSCQACGVTSAGGQYCVSCGQPLVPAMSAVAVRERARPERNTNAWLALQEIRLLACPKCGAPNSAARWQCARCGETFADRGDDELPADVTPTSDQVTPTQPEPAPWLGLITVVAGVAVVAVAVVLLASRGVGPFSSDGDATAVSPMVQAGVTEVRSSGSAATASVQRGLVDGDPATAWLVEGDAEDEWVELRLDKAAKIDHLLVWNGDQRDDSSFASTNRVRDVLISFPDARKRYTAVFPDVDANFRVDMVDPPVSKRIRIKIKSVYGDANRTALSEVEALVNSPSAATPP